jgi:phosphatidylglycerophosphatase C
MIDKKTTIAVFDLDGTITNKDTFLEFIKYYRGSIKFYTGLLVLFPFVILFYLKLYSNNRLKECFFYYFFKGKPAIEIDKKGDKFSTEILPLLSRKPAIDILEWHQNKNHDILILSASSDIWLKKWCMSKNYKLICTSFKKNKNSYTGKIDGENCFGTRKRELLFDFLNKNNYSFSYGYGDSKSDKYFLELVDRPYLMKLNKKNVKIFWNE